MDTPYSFSNFGEKYCGPTGIGELMDDLGQALSGARPMRMLGGGNPAGVPSMQVVWRRRMEELLADGDRFDQVLGNYDSPRGSAPFVEALCGCLNRAFGWEIGPENVAVTMGGQAAFFFLFNMLAGQMPDGSRRHILFPLSPEYIGYADQSLDHRMFRSALPLIDKRGDHRFKYGVDFEHLEVNEETAALCVSRPTNPTGNVLTDEEIARLAGLAEQHGIPLIIDNAYGAPFPNVIFTEARPVWTPDIILTLSLSKLGLPGTRTGIVIARPEITRALAGLTSIMGLANNNVGQALVQGLMERHELIPMCRENIQPFYRARSEKAQAWVEELLDDRMPYRVHESEGAFFLWMWFPGLPITTYALYERLKERGVLMVPGQFFFFGREDHGAHRDECIRMSFTPAEEDVREGIRVLAEEVSRAYREGGAL